MNKRIIQFIWGIILLSVIIACDKKNADNTPDYVAKVGAEIISQENLDFEIDILTADGLAPNKDTNDWKSLENSVLQDLIERKLFILEANRKNIVVSKEEVKETVLKLSNGLDKNTYTKIIKDTGLNEDEIKSRTREMILVEKLFQSEIIPRILIKENELKAHWKKTIDKYKHPEMVRVKQIVVKTLEEATKARRRIFAGESFAKVAKEVSIMPEKDRGGDLGWISDGMLPDPFNKLVFELPKHIVNKPVESSYGFHVIYITEHKKAGNMTISEVKQAVERELFDIKKRQAKTDLLNELKRRFPVEIATVQKKKKG